MKILVLLSGGIDSATVLYMMREHSREAIGFSYGQLSHTQEYSSAYALAKNENVRYEQIELGDDCALLMMGEVNKPWPARNAIFISLAAAYATKNGFDGLAIGCNQTDWEIFPDCRPDFVKHLGKALEDGYGLKLFAPLIHMSKAQVVDKAKELGVPLAQTWSCYRPENGKPCYTCLACTVRAKAGA